MVHCGHAPCATIPHDQNIELPIVIIIPPAHRAEFDAGQPRHDIGEGRGLRCRHEQIVDERALAVMTEADLGGLPSTQGCGTQPVGRFIDGISPGLHAKRVSRVVRRDFDRVPISWGNTRGTYSLSRAVADQAELFGQVGAVLDGGPPFGGAAPQRHGNRVVGSHARGRHEHAPRERRRVGRYQRRVHRVGCGGGRAQGHILVS